MLLILSPSKTLDEKPAFKEDFSQPVFLKETNELIDQLKQLTSENISNLMSISEKLSKLNYKRFQTFHSPFTLKNAKQALLAFKGDVYSGIATESYTDKDFAFAQKHLRILSGLYGILKPLDLMQPYRLEMGTKLSVHNFKNLYDFWGNKLTNLLDSELSKASEPILINLASNEYFKAIKTKNLKANLINIEFKENKQGKLKVIGIHAKKARGLMANYVIKNRIETPEKLKEFHLNGYNFNSELSDKNSYIFTRNLD